MLMDKVECLLCSNKTEWDMKVCDECLKLLGKILGFKTVKIQSNTMQLDKEQIKTLVKWLKSAPYLKDKLVLYLHLNEQKLCVRNIELEQEVL